MSEAKAKCFLLSIIIFTIMKMDTQRNWYELLPGWKMQLCEVSNGHYEVLFVDDHGRKASTSGTDPDEIKAIGEQYVLDIERQLKGTFNLFLYNLFKMRLSGKVISEERYDDKVFGSWFIQVNKKRLVLDGKDFLIILQIKNRLELKWVDETIIRLSEFKVSDLNKMIAAC